MSEAVRKLAKEFEQLPEAERQQVLAEQLRHSAVGTPRLPDDQRLVMAADRVFQELDQREHNR